MNNRNEKPEPEEVNAHKANGEVIILPDQDISLTELLRYIEAGKTVILIPAPRKAALAARDKQSAPWP
ncbi:MAG: hypothetical protein J2P25_01390, partial [Nocardiopsaceae bacterium]|nr:hypothetical protein [Nocardiopsaceae bacterium]